MFLFLSGGTITKRANFSAQANFLLTGTLKQEIVLSPENTNFACQRYGLNLKEICTY